MPATRRRFLYINDFLKGDYLMTDDSNTYFRINKVNSQILDQSLNPENPQFNQNILSGKYFLFDDEILYIVQYVQTPQGRNPELYLPHFRRLLVRTQGDNSTGPRWEFSHGNDFTFHDLTPETKFYSCDLLNLPQYEDETSELLDKISDIEFVYNSNSEAMVATRANTITQSGEQLLLPSTRVNENQGATVYSLAKGFFGGKRHKLKSKRTKKNKRTKRSKKSRKYIHSKKF